MSMGFVLLWRCSRHWPLASPQICSNSIRGSQFTSAAYTDALTAAGVAISMEGALAGPACFVYAEAAVARSMSTS